MAEVTSKDSPLQPDSCYSGLNVFEVQFGGSNTFTLLRVSTVCEQEEGRVKA